MSDARLKHHLDALIAGSDHTAHVSNDPLAYPHRYDDPADQEVAALFAALLAFGRVDLFRAVLDDWFAWLDARGGPAQAARGFRADDATDLLPLFYRWTRGVDLALLTAATGRVLRDHGSLQALFDHPGDLRTRLTLAVDTLRAAAVAEAPALGLDLADASELSRGFRYLVSSPRDGSGCKRWNLFLRWMVRDEPGVDLGLWTSIAARDLVMPVDTHVLRISQFVGLTTRKTGSWRTSAEITARLARLDPDDPVKYDFALAHLGISNHCLGHRDAQVCPSCPLDRICQAPAG